MSDAGRGAPWARLFQDAAMEPSRWLAALGVLAEETGSARAQLIGVGHAGAVPFNWVTGIDPDAVADFARLDMALPEVNYRIAASLAAMLGTIVHERHYRIARAKLASDLYLDFCRDHEIWSGCQSVLAEENRAMIGLALLRRDRDGETTPEIRAAFAEAARAARGAVRLQRAMEGQGVALMTGALETVSAACLLLDSDGSITGLTAAGEQAVAAAPDLAIVDRRLTSPVAVVSNLLDQALVAAITRATAASVRLREGRRVDLFPVARREWSMGLAPVVIAVLRDPTAALGASLGTLAAEYNLSPAEAAVLALVARGLSRREIAAGRGVSEETVRAQIRSIYAKTDCAREAEIVALVWGNGSPSA